MTVTQAWAGYITKAEKDPVTGHLNVFGKASGPDLDLDGQIADPRWLRKAMPEWMAWGNVREMHRPSAAGVGKELSADGDDWNLKALVVDRGAVEKVETGVYKGFSIGIKDPKVIRDATAPGGRIVGGTIVEVSLVDRPCNPTATMGIAKAYGADLGPVEWAGEVVGKAADPQDDEPATAPADLGEGGTRPVDDGDDTDDGDDRLLADAAAKAVRTAGRPLVTTVDDPPLYTEVAKGLSATVSSDVLTPTEYRKATATVSAVLAGTLVKRKADESADIAGAQAVVAQLARLIISEATELAAGRMDEAGDIECLMSAVRAVKQFLWHEQCQDGSEVPDMPDDGGSDDGGMAWVGLSANADTEKRYISADEREKAAKSGAAMPDGSYPIRNVDELKAAIHLAGHGKGSQAEIRAHIRKRAAALGQSAMIPDSWSEKVAAPDGATKATAPDLTKMIDDAVTKATAASEGRINALEAELAKVRATPVPGGPFIMPVAARPTPTNDRGSRAQNFALQAQRATDPAVAHAYRAAAVQAAGTE